MYGRTFVLVTVCSGFALGACTTQESEPNGVETVETSPSVYESVHEELTLYTFVERFITEGDVLQSVAFEEGQITVHVVLDDPARLDDLFHDVYLALVARGYAWEVVSVTDDATGETFEHVVPPSIHN